MGHWQFRIGHFENGCPQTKIITIFGFWGPDINDKDTQINVLSILFAEIWDIENSWRPFWKWLPQPSQTNTIATFGLLDSENLDIETIINFLSILFAEIWDIENSWRPFLKWLPLTHTPIYLPYFESGTLTTKTKTQQLTSYLYYSPRYGTL